MSTCDPQRSGYWLAGWLAEGMQCARGKLSDLGTLEMFYIVGGKGVCGGNPGGFHDFMTSTSGPAGSIVAALAAAA